MSVVLKIVRKGQIHRIHLESSPDYEAVVRAIKLVWPDMDACSAKYVDDDDGSSCTLSEVTFPKWIALAKEAKSGSRLLKLEVDEIDNLEDHCKDDVLSPGSWIHVPSGEPLEEEEHEAAEAIPFASTVQPQGVEAYKERASSPVEEYQIHTPKNSSPRGLDDADRCTYVDVNPETLEDQPAVAEHDLPEQKGVQADAEDMHSCIDDKSERAEQASPFSLQVLGRALEEHDVPEVEEASPQAHGNVDWQNYIHATDKLSIVFAVFDTNQDGHLNYEESNRLQVAAGGTRIPLETFKALCAEYSEDDDVGLGPDALIDIYSKSGMLERDFEAAKQVLETDRELHVQEESSGTLGKSVMTAAMIGLTLTASVLTRYRRRHF